MNASRPQKVIKLASAFVVIFAGILLAVPPNVYPALQKIDGDFNTIDGSWAVALPVALANREIAGRDFIFTYGPLYQVTHALGLLVPPFNLASLLRFQYFIEALLVMLGVWLVLALAKAPLFWRAAFFLLWASFWPHWLLLNGAGLKPMGGLFLSAIAGYVLAEPTEMNRRVNLIRAILTWTIAVPVLLLYAFDVGILAFLALILTGTTVFLICRPGFTDNPSPTRRKAAMCLAAAVLSLVVFIIVLSLVGSWSHYMSDSWQLASGYAMAMAVPIGRKTLPMLVAGCTLGLIFVFSCSYLRSSWRKTSASSARTLALLSMACYSMMWMRSGLTRSDFIHVFWMLLPTLFLAACFLPCYLRAEKFRFAWLTAVISTIFFLFVPYGIDTPLKRTLVPPIYSWIASQLGAIRNLQMEGAQLEISHSVINEASSVARTLSGDSLYIWPYETVVNAITGKRMVNYTLQSYAATTTHLEDATIARLEAEQNLPTILFASGSLDEVEALSRTPRIFRYLLEHYEMAGPRHKEFLVLRRSNERRGQWEEHELSVAPGSFDPGSGHSLKISLRSEPAAECHASDLLTLQLRVAKTRMFGFRKTGEIVISFHLSDGELRTQKLAVPPDGQPHNVIISASTLRDPLFLSIFAPQRLWRSSERVSAIELRWKALDWLSARPSGIAVEHVSVIRRLNVQTVESPLAQEDQPALWKWCYEGGVYPVK